MNRYHDGVHHRVDMDEETGELLADIWQVGLSGLCLVWIKLEIERSRLQAHLPEVPAINSHQVEEALARASRSNSQYAPTQETEAIASSGSDSEAEGDEAQLLL
jgi:hypothetical protein